MRRTEKEKEILDIIINFIEEKGYSPTIREICGLSGLTSTSSVHGYIKRLKAKGHITNEVERPRSISLTKKEKKIKFVVNAIALKRQDDKEYILLKENKKLKAKASMLELPGGVIRADENVYVSLRRKLYDKGFEVTKIFGEDKCNELSKDEETVTVFKPFCVSQSYAANNSIISNTIVCEVENTKVEDFGDKYDFKWVCTEDLEDMLVDQKENIYAHNIVALKSFCKA